MVTIIDDPYSGNVFGRIGKGFGQGLSEQLPKEIERGRLASGLQRLSNEGQNLDPLEYFAKAAGLPGMTPQIIDTLGQLLRQKQQGQALKSFQQGQSEFPQGIIPSQMGQDPNAAPSITTREGVEATTRPFIPRTSDQILADAAKSFQANPAFFKNDPQAAIDFEYQKDAQNQSVNQAVQAQRKGEQDVQNVIKSGLESQKERLNALAPGTVYSKIEDKAIKAVLSRSEGGEGLTEQQAIKKYGDELDAISRDYSNLEGLGKNSWTLLSKKPKENLKNIQALQKSFAERNDLENFADSLVSKNGLSNQLAYYLAYPISQEKELSDTISKLPDLSKKKGFPNLLSPGSMIAGQALKQFSEGDISKKTEEVSSKIAPLLGKKGSPLAVAMELEKLGYDPNAWLKYLDQHREELDLTENQVRQLAKTRKPFFNLNDAWLIYMSGQDSLLE